MTSSRRLKSLLGLAAAAAACGGSVSPCGAAQPTRTTIVLDGSFDDWQTVLANPANLVLDGDGSTVPCPESADRDCLVTSASSDVRRMAITWDDQNLYLYVERMAPANNQTFLLYVDRDHDGRFGDTDLVLDHLFKASQDEIQPTKRLYLPLNPSGDPTEDALGYGDGYTPPGGATAAINTPGDPSICATCTSGDGLTFEFAWPWTSLGLPPGAAVIYHLSSGGSASGTKDDNLGGPGDRRGSTRFFSHSLTAPLFLAGAPGQAVLMPHTILNEGNWTDGAELRVTSSLGMEVCLYDDPDGDGAPDSLLACDRQGNGSWSDSGDFVSPSADSNGDGSPDTGPLAPGATFHFVGQIVPGNKHNRDIEETRYYATSQMDPLVAPTLRDETAIGYVSVIPRRDGKAVPNGLLRLPHKLINHLPTQDVFAIHVTSTQGWNYTVYSDPDEDGDPSDGVPVFDQDGDTDPDVNIVSGGTFPVVLETTVPAATPFGVTESVTLEARSTGSVRGEMTDRVLIAQEVELRPDYTVANGMAKAGSSSYPTFFRHYLTWNGGEPARFDLLALSSQGYTVDFYTDPNGDGNPADGQLLPEPVSSPTIAPNGGTWVFLARISVPLGAVGGTVDSTDVYALLSTNGLVFASASDETRVTLIQAFNDPNYTVAVSHMPVCSTVYARATGLTPSIVGRYRIVWDDPAGARVRTFPFTPDGSGEGFDALDLSASAPTGPWSAAIQEYDGVMWTDLDRTGIEVENEGVMDALFPDQNTYSYADTTLTATAVFRNSGVSDLGPLDIGFRVLDPSETLYLKSNGSFRGYTGTQDTWTLSNLRPAPGESYSDTFSVVDVTWPASGTYVLEAYWRNVCGQTVATTRRSFVVTADFDGDGLPDDVEAANGLDWMDRDSDDDGLLDGVEGIADSDGDTLPDALDCDSDGDGLPDSLEAGLVATGLDPDTDLSAGCFRADGDGGATTTSPTQADTDGGGLDDGREDLDADGVVDPGEKDPSAAWDDPCAVSPPPDVEGLRVARTGGDLVLSWKSLTDTDPCVNYRVWEAPSLRPRVDEFSVAADGLGTPSHGQPDVPGPRAFLVQSSGRFAGDGPFGYTGP